MIKFCETCLENVSCEYDDGEILVDCSEPSCPFSQIGHGDDDYTLSPYEELDFNE